MRILKNTALVFALVLIVSGCNHLLDVEPQAAISEDVALDSPDNVESMLIGAYSMLNHNTLYGGQLLYLPDLLSDAGEVVWAGTFFPQREVWLKTIATGNGVITNTWTNAYNAINRANLVIGNLDVVRQVDEARARRLEGEARLIRAMFYFDLVRLYGQPWSAGNQQSNLGVPLKLQPTMGGIGDDAYTPRHTVAEVYAQVIEDLTQAKAQLPESNGVFANTYVASGLLARVYLTQERWQEAAEEANRVIASGSFQLMPTYAQAFNNSANTAEDVFAIQISSTDPTDRWNSMNQFYASDAFGGRGDIDIQDAHLALYEEGDARLALFYDDAGTWRSGKWNNRFEGNVNFMRLAEMYLIRAEANFRAGSSIGATPAEDLNRIRERVNLDPLGTVTLDDILRERKLELAFEGHLLHDTKRLRQNVGALPYDHNRLVYPIPQREREVNPDLVQNPGYGG